MLATGSVIGPVGDVGVHVVPVRGRDGLHQALRRGAAAGVAVPGVDGPRVAARLGHDDLLDAGGVGLRQVDDLQGLRRSTRPRPPRASSSRRRARSASRACCSASLAASVGCLVQPGEMLVRRLRGLVGSAVSAATGSSDGRAGLGRSERCGVGGVRWCARRAPRSPGPRRRPRWWPRRRPELGTSAVKVPVATAPSAALVASTVVRSDGPLGAGRCAARCRDGGANS